MARRWQSAILWLGLLAGAFFMGYPYVYMFGNSLKTRFEFASDKASVWPERLRAKLGVQSASAPDTSTPANSAGVAPSQSAPGSDIGRQAASGTQQGDGSMAANSAAMAPGTQTGPLRSKGSPATTGDLRTAGRAAVTTQPSRPPAPPTVDWSLWKNYSDALTFGRVGIYLRNSFFYALVGTIVQLVFDVLAAYAFARMTFRGRDLLFGLVLSTMMLPPAVLLVPQFLVAKDLGMVDTFIGVIAPGAAGAFGIFMLRQFFLNIPADLENAARIDGCSDFGILWRILVPLAKPALITLGLFIFLGTWNSFVWPLVILSDWNMYPLTVGLSLFREESTADWPRIFAASVMGSLPLVALFLVAQRYLIGGIALSGMKN